MGHGDRVLHCDPVCDLHRALYALYAAFTQHADPFHLSLLAGTAGVLVLSVALAAVGVGVAACLLCWSLRPS